MNKVTKPRLSHTFGYWRPWNEGANFYESYMDYLRDKSLEQYGANAIGNYIQAASQEQVNAIYTLGAALGRGMSVLSDKLTDLNNELVFLNRNMDVILEQQKMNNLLLQNITVLLRIPDYEKERQLRIELGIKFFVNAQNDPDLYDDALEELHKAEQLRKQDYFVLHRLGMIYQYSEKHIDLNKSLDYFLKAAKYASADTSPEAGQLANALSYNISDGVMKKGSKNVPSSKMLTAASYEKAAFASYVLGQFDKAVHYQRMALDNLNTAQYRFQLSKYLVRSGKVTQAVDQLSQAIDAEPELAIAVFKELDLLSEPEIIQLVNEKNETINKKIENLIVSCRKNKSNHLDSTIAKLTELKQMSYEVKIKLYPKLKRSASKNSTKLSETKSLIDDLVKRIRDGAYINLTKTNKNAMISELLAAKKQSVEFMTKKLKAMNNMEVKHRVTIGSRYGGGIVFHIDNVSNRRYVFADRIIGQACWSPINGKIGAFGTKIGTGQKNTSIILEKGSVKNGLFRENIPVQTAARICSELNYAGCSDWFLPSEEELEKIFALRNRLGISDMKLSCWSSTESSDGDNAICINFKSSGNKIEANKNQHFSIIAVRIC